MTTRDLLHAAIDDLDARSVDAVYQIVRQYTSTQTPSRSGELLTRLQTIKIDGPVDFAANIDHYLKGEKGVADDVH